VANVTISSNAFRGVPFPLVVGDRFFHAYERDGRMLTDVFRWDADLYEATYEVVANEPQADNIASNPTGIVTVADADDGGFLYKLRPKPGISQIFGKVPLDDELTVHCSDTSLRVLRGSDVVMDARSNLIVGCPIGVQVGVDGSVALGVSRLPDGMTLVHRDA
jgi:hypothetical protein